MKLSFKKVSTLAAATVLAASMASCSSPDGGPASAAGSASTSVPELSGTLTVFAAASLKQTFTELATQFEAAHPQVKVSLSFDGSSTLVTQITQGAPADVFASADTKNMTKLSDAKLTSEAPVDFATNVLTLAVPPSNPANITAFADVAKPGVKLVICAAQVPCGAAAKADAATAGLMLTPVSEELSVTGVLGKVTSGEADAGLVYVTDAKSAGDKVKTIPLGLAQPTINEYPIAAVKGSKNPEIAAAFISLVTAQEGQKVLQDAGFGAP
ncbi:molybdate transport system substrate-binding protein [Arthrobacter alpinus]|uniref:Molybdate-binding protein ModA n=1 Tax=Arthrobacter alpinus TaxID=656366 RepID=A0A1H5DYZ5_9MICC|nr:molybdate ABC transporter substrate-binding protein [Arthrobacter alpinus]SED84095.1 molybdate transport system substrate-binding protein [Arthrobacter alpinus]